MSAAALSVTVAVLTCNQGRFLSACLDSIAAQSLRPLRLQIFDNGSRDDTPALVETFRRRAPADIAISVHRFDYLGGPAAFVNAAAPLLQGEVVIFQHGDDVAEPERAARLAALFAARPRALLAHSAALATDAAGRPLETLSFPPVPPHAQAAHYARVQGYVLGATMAVRRVLLERFPPLDERAFEDAQLPFRAALAGEIAYAPERLLRYRRHGGNVTHALHSLASLAAARQARAEVLTRMAALAEIRRADLAHFLRCHPEARTRLARLDKAIAESLALAQDEAELWSRRLPQRLSAWRRLAGRGRGLRAALVSGLLATSPALEVWRRRRRRGA